MIDFRRLLLRPGDGDYGDMTFFKFSWNTTDNACHKYGTKVVCYTHKLHCWVRRRLTEDQPTDLHGLLSCSQPLSQGIKENRHLSEAWESGAI